MFFSSLIVQIISMFFKEWMIYDVIQSIAISLCSFIFYKIFANSIIVIKEYQVKTAFSIEEVVGASMLFAIATSAFKGINIFGLHLQNILSILIVLILGWKNGILLGTTSGVTIGAVIGIINMEGPVIIAAYAISGMLAGIFSKLGKLRSNYWIYCWNSTFNICYKWKYNRNYIFKRDFSCIYCFIVSSK